MPPREGVGGRGVGAVGQGGRHLTAHLLQSFGQGRQALHGLQQFLPELGGTGLILIRRTGHFNCQ